MKFSLCSRRYGRLLWLLLLAIAILDANALNPYMTEWMQYVDSYPSSYQGGPEGEVYILIDEDEYGIAIGSTYALDEGEAFILILDKQLPAFRSKLKQMLEKSKRWTETAKENNVSESICASTRDIKSGYYICIRSNSEKLGHIHVIISGCQLFQLYERTDEPSI